jgi:hypothetical protein
VKRGRPLVEGERRDVEMKLRLTKTMKHGIDNQRGTQSAQNWVRDLIREALK